MSSAAGLAGSVPQTPDRQGGRGPGSRRRNSTANAASKVYFLMKQSCQPSHSDISLIQTRTVQSMNFSNCSYRESPGTQRLSVAARTFGAYTNNHWKLQHSGFTADGPPDWSGTKSERFQKHIKSEKTLLYDRFQYHLPAARMMFPLVVRLNDDKYRDPVAKQFLRQAHIIFTDGLDYRLTIFQLKHFLECLAEFPNGLLSMRRATFINFLGLDLNLRTDLLLRSTQQEVLVLGLSTEHLTTTFIRAWNRCYDDPNGGGYYGAVNNSVNNNSDLCDANEFISSERLGVVVRALRKLRTINFFRKDDYNEDQQITGRDLVNFLRKVSRSIRQIAGRRRLTVN
ncbi:hypothetical protein BDV96DRAFT_655359 [Lophiotrema nucula]|uniref:EF-hand domain-containing protein n=1 Tax=Lophiotrema nucula TaxID=690887 RepID=A0A6A5YH90_9PLEO|nr:hypothetical protein BDV96DRAFT_655359 [Lophiotrema nucula]